METVKFTDIPGIKVGNAEDLKGMTGCTVIICEEGACAGVDVRGGAPGTRETDLLNPVNLVDKVHAVFLSGGSSFGLDAAS
ncbi:MAG TPA: peptidase, partial [Clostridiaceae bacterium]|nr:peptidase [Clostridiaceae bacterium]